MPTRSSRTCARCPAVDHTVKPNEPPFSLYNDGTIAGDAAAVQRGTVPHATPRSRCRAAARTTQSAMRGRYLAAQVGLCIDCHTPETARRFALELDTTKFVRAAAACSRRSSSVSSIRLRRTRPHRDAQPDARRDRPRRLDASEQIKDAIAKGKDRDGKAVCAATHGGLISPYAALEPQDLDDIVEYIINLPPVENDTAGSAAPPIAARRSPAAPEATRTAATTRRRRRQRSR